MTTLEMKPCPPMNKQHHVHFLSPEPLTDEQIERISAILSNAASVATPALMDITEAFIAEIKAQNLAADKDVGCTHGRVLLGVDEGIMDVTRLVRIALLPYLTPQAGVNWAANIIAAVEAWRRGEDESDDVIAKAESYARAALALPASSSGDAIALVRELCKSVEWSRKALQDFANDGEQYFEHVKAEERLDSTITAANAWLEKNGKSK